MTIEIEDYSTDSISRRYDFVMHFDVEWGNPNGDPDADGMPRVDDETGQGIVTDVCIKRKVRNYVEERMEGTPGYDIYIKRGTPLNVSDARALAACETTLEELAELKKKDPGADEKIRDFMCGEFYDVRTFGAVMTTFVKGALSCGQVRGPVQLNYGRSLDPIMPMEQAITREAITTVEDYEKKSKEMGRRSVVPYGMYRMEGNVSAVDAQKSTGFSERDLALFFDALLGMFDCDHASGRGKMALRSLIVFKHENIYGNAPSWKLFDAVDCRLRDGVAVPRSHKDYTPVTVERSLVPDSVEVRELV